MTTYDSTTVYDAASLTFDGAPAQSTTFPIAGVFVAFTDGPYVAEPSWTEITPYVRAISTSRGRADDLEDFPAGTAQLVLDNRDRRFDPFYTSGPYYQQLTPRRQIRIVGQANGVNYEVFRGYVAGWPVQWSEAGYDSTVTIQCFDALGLMANEVVPTDWVYEYTTSLNPYRYFRADDVAPSVLIQEVEGRDRLRQTAASDARPFFEYSPLAPGLQAGSLGIAAYYNFDTATSTYPTTSVSGDQDFTVTAWVQMIGQMRTGFITAFLQVQYGGRGLTLRYDYSNATYTLSTPAFSGTQYSYATNGSLAQQAPFFLTMTYTAATNTGRIYINNEERTSTGTASAASLLSNNRFLVNIESLAFQELVVYPRVLSTAERTNLYNYGSARYLETTSARMTRLRATTDYPATLTSFTSSPIASVSEIGTGAGVIQELQLTADSEGGELYVSKAGVLTMTARFDAFNATRSATSQATFTDSGAGLEYGPELLIEYDADTLKNDITVTYSGDGEVNVYNDANIAEYGGAATTIETYLDTPAAASGLATAKSGVYGTLVPRISPIDVSVNTAAADWQTILGLELLDRVTFKRTPSVGNQFDRDALIQGIDHQIEPGVWRTQLTLSMRYTSPLIVGDTVRGRVDFNYCG